MKNITLSLSEELLRKSRAYAQKQGSTLNELVRTLLRQTVESDNQHPAQKLIAHTQRLQVATKNWKWNRTEIYDRKIFS